MEPINSTTFLTLPTILQLKITKLTTWQDQKNLRLVCGHTLGLVNHLGASSTILNSRYGNPLLFKRLKTCPFSSIKCLALGDLTTPLPIKSSTRLLIPKANSLEIGSNISPENLFKLIRYYMKWCKTLHFCRTNLPFIKNIAQFGPSQTCLVNVKTFKIDFVESHFGLRFTTAADFQQRLRSFGQFLLWCSMPSLQKLILSIQQDEPPSDSTHPNDNKFHENLQKFLIKHGPRLNSLSLLLSPSFWVTIMPTFECMVNLEKFRIHKTFGPSLSTIDQAVILNGFKHFAKLKSIRLDSGNERNFLASLLLSNNPNTIQSLDLGNILSSLDWFYKIQSSFPNLACLDLKIRYKEHSTIFTEHVQQANENFKLNSLYKLKILIESQFQASGSEQQGENLLDWRESFINWLIVISPNLQQLHLTYFDTTTPRISDILLMIHGLTRLRRLTFQSFHLNEFGLFQSWTLQRHPNIISADLQNWVESNPQIQLNLQHSDEFEVNIDINRPYILGQQPEEEEVEA